ncbi:hypothetical protein OG601_46980 [Streptomyces sp. NBC_01239]|uniref:hypothetical protein n=1 Tax=Streptomyces sp. NBC_01239 TaxID=2903792 RepID=UPI002257721D|nr:hypothetical protein [Streptomyces sp. NBC_01239]MCX4809064.1 hypothetical protein [Streptomyces sp. NBC_01239]MCX4818119.1 hypothetical protein [Streptomyces sp. NBC_01239]
MDQLALFGDDEVVGTGRPFPWPTTAEPEPETAEENPDQLAFGDADTGAAA